MLCGNGLYFLSVIAISAHLSSWDSWIAVFASWSVGLTMAEGKRQRNRTLRQHLSVAVCRSPDWLHGEKWRDSTRVMLECLWSSFSTAPVIFSFSPSLPLSPLSLSLCLYCPSHFIGLRSLCSSNLSLWQDKALISHKPFPPTVTGRVSGDSRDARTNTQEVCTSDAGMPTNDSRQSDTQWQKKKWRGGGSDKEKVEERKTLQLLFSYIVKKRVYSSMFMHMNGI